MAAFLCPTCQREAPGRDSKTFPFCCERCRLVDLGRWLREEYRIPGDPVVPPEDSET